MKLMVLPDAHAHPKWGNDRFALLGHFVVDERPDVLVCLGDFSDLPSLSSYDKGKRGFEGRRYKDDVDVTIDAQERLFAPISQFNASRRKSGKAQYKPKCVMLLGNHEHRIEKATNDSAELHGTIGIEDLQYARFWDEVWDFGEIRDIGGFACSHHFVSGVQGRPIGGNNHASSILSKHFQSAIAGHAHTRDYAERTRADGKKVSAIVAGNYGHLDYSEGWCATTRHLWWNGITVLDGVQDGTFESLRFIDQAALKRKYT
jgi:predicted phosphodiesterase